MTEADDDAITCDGCGNAFPEPVFVKLASGARYCADEQIRHDERRDGWFCDDCWDCRETAEDAADDAWKERGL